MGKRIATAIMLIFLLISRDTILQASTEEFLQNNGVEETLEEAESREEVVSGRSAEMDGDTEASEELGEIKEMESLEKGTDLQNLTQVTKGVELYQGWAYTISNGCAVIQGYDGTETDVKIPKQIEGYTVTELGYYILSGENQVVRLTIPNTVKTISVIAFRYADNLEAIEVESNSKYFCSVDGVLLTADKQELVSYPPGKKNSSYKIPSGVKTIWQNGFAFADYLQSVTFPSSVRTLGSCAFIDCSSLTNVKLNEKLTTISDRAFMGCYALKSLHIPKNVKDIYLYNSLFDACLSLESITVDSKNKYYASKGGVLFDKSRKILICYPAGKKDKSYVVPKTVESIYHMDENYYLQKLTLQKGVREIHVEALRNDTALQKVVFSSTVEKIYDGAFIGCRSLKTVTLPKKVSVVSGNVFYSCISLEKIVFKNPDCYICPFASTISKQTIICGTKDSTAYRYAKGFGRTFRNSDTSQETVFQYDNNTLFSLLPTSEVSFGEQAVQSFTIWSDGVFQGYQTSIIHESDEKNANYIELKNKVDELTQNCSNDMQKVEVISKWVSQNMTYIYGFMSGYNIKSVYAIYKNMAGNCMCYTQLTNYMLYLAGISTVDIVSAGHEWGAAYVNGRWVNVDSTNRLIGEEASYYDDIESISFSSNRMVFTINNCEGVYLAGIGYDDLDKEKVKEITIPSYVIGIYDNVFDDVSSKLLVHGKRGSYAEKYVKKHFKFIIYKGNEFTACNQSFIKGSSITKISAASKGFTVKWKRQQKKITGYELQYSTNSQFSKKKTVTKTVAGRSRTTLTVKKLKQKRRYYVRIRTYMVSSGKKTYSDWSKVKTVVTK